MYTPVPGGSGFFGGSSARAVPAVKVDNRNAAKPNPIKELEYMRVSPEKKRPLYAGVSSPFFVATAPAEVPTGVRRDSEEV
jgi:hypothetical protein